MMSERPSLEDFLIQARNEEERYDWPAATASYSSALCLAKASEDFSKAGEFQERIGYCLYRGAFQAETQEQFKIRLLKAEEAYEGAHGFYEKSRDEQKIARMLRCEAIIKYLGYWLTAVPSEKRVCLDDCLELEGKALACFSASGDMLEYGRTYNELWLVSWLRANLEWNRRTKKSIMKRGLQWGEKTVAALTQLDDPHELARTHHTLSRHLGEFEVFTDEPEDQEKNRLQIVQYLNEAIDFSDRVGDDYLLGKSHARVIHLYFIQKCSSKGHHSGLRIPKVDFEQDSYEPGSESVSHLDGERLGFFIDEGITAPRYQVAFFVFHM